MIASKVVCDGAYSNKSWAVVAQGMFSLKDLNRMEREMCDYLEWELTFDGPILSTFEKLVTRDFSTDRAFYLSYPLGVFSKRAPCADASTDTQVALYHHPTSATTTVPSFDEDRGPPPTSAALHPHPPSSQQRVHAPHRSSSPSPGSKPDTPRPGHSITTSPTTPASQTPASFQSNTALISGVDPPPTTPVPSQTLVDLQNDPAQIHGTSPSPLRDLHFAVVDEAPQVHPLWGRMFAFAVPSTF